MILSKIDSLYRQPNLFRLFLSTSSVLEHELKTHISDVLKTVYLLLVQIGCFHIYKNFFQSCNKSHLAVQIWCGKRLPEQSRNIVLMFFFLDMSDSEIGEKLNINRSTSYRHRRNSLEEIRKQLKEKKTNEE